MTGQILFSLELLRSVSGASMAILLVVQLIKDFPVIKLLPTKCIAIVIGVLLFLLISPFPSSLGEFAVIVLNGFLSASTAIGGWHMMSDFSTKGEQK
ncbi:hypothetical protein [Desulfitobacterium sp.]|uniref:hypothetical protein n=1 Tax=Desulfitobacterium sp. TaxID=49981 RepID=UPI002C1FFB2F|nr:hypothetical protein [Desulfitobacterium sp.]HVJ50104.1 hypothetical protein [Desulfitobacterium sp.]